ncbi:hypothetical protein BH10ACI2_BH10ACI2_24170 [soil metagenome]
MKTFIFTMVSILILTGVFFVAAPENVAAQQTYFKKVVQNGRIHYVRVKKPSFYRRHRDATNIAIGTGGGAILGSLIGGKKGALIGAGIGAGGSALYTYKFNKNTKKYYRVRRY